VRLSRCQINFQIVADDTHAAFNLQNFGMCRWQLKRILHRRRRARQGATAGIGLEPERKDRRKPSGSLGPAGLPAQQDTGANSSETAVPYDPWDAKQVPTCGWRSAPLLKAQPADANLRSLFGFASHQMSLWSPDRNLETAAPDFKEASKGPAGPEHEAKRGRGELTAAARLRHPVW
jgi:hypothetical protein